MLGLIEAPASEPLTGSQERVHLVWESEPESGRMSTAMKRHRHTLEQAVRKVREGERLLNEGKDLAEVLRRLEVTEST